MNVIEREKHTINKMIRIYCAAQHRPSASGQLCESCLELLDYAHRRLERCPKGNSKSSCRKCEIHCYSSDKREQIRAVMRFAGPRMLLVSPMAALRHFFK